MAIYKVPQDVEADDKLIGPFSFRQFVYLIIVTLALIIAWFLGKLFLPLSIIPLPIIIFFGALALPLRKDQPMEIFMAAMAMYFLKPRRRIWIPDGIESLIEITVPKVVETVRTKNISQAEAEQEFKYLAQISDTRGWATRGVMSTMPDSAMNSDVYFAAQQVSDILDNDTTIARSLSEKLTQSDARKHQEIINTINTKANTPDQDLPKPPVFNPYPTEIHQTVIQPLSSRAPHQNHSKNDIANKPPTTSERPISPAIMNLANNNNLSIETIAHEAKRIQESEEVIISLR